MFVEHSGRRPQVDATAWIAPNAVLSGAVSVGPNSRVLYGATLTAESGAELVVGSGCVVMEQAVLRAAGRFPLRLGDRVLVGPHAHLSGCRVGAYSFVATGAMIFNGAVIGEGCVVALGGKVHIDTELKDGTWVPIGYIAFGRPATIYPPDQAPAVHERLNQLGFARYVFGVDSEGRSRAQIMEELTGRYTRALEAHRQDKVITP